MNILLTIQQKRSNLSPNAKKLADYVTKHHAEVSLASVQELANSVQVSPSTIVRFAKQLGLTGYPELKVRLAAINDENDDQVIQEVQENESVASIKQKLALRVGHMVDQTNQHLSDQSVVRIAKTIDSYSKIYVYGIGASALVAQDLMQKFSRIGRLVFFTQDEHLLLSSIAAQNDPTLLMIVSNSGKTSEIVHVMEATQELASKIILLTGNDNSPAAKLADLVLATNVNDESPLRVAATVSLLAQLYIVDVLFYSYISHYYQSSSEKVQKSKSSVSRLKLN